jgi:anti-sigma factor RsiW
MGPPLRFEQGAQFNMHPTEEVLNELVDGTLKPAQRSEAERHLATCTECRAMVAELRELRRAVESLEPRDLPAHVWPRIERAIRLEHEIARGFQPADRRADASEAAQASGKDRRGVLTRVKDGRFLWPGLAAAAAIVLATSLTLRLVHRESSAERPGAGGVAQTTDGTDTAQAVEAELRQASEHYERAIKGLEQIANAEQGSLDPQTAATLRKNLAVIDQAISESRAALHSQPNSEPAQQSLIDSFKTKIALLQDTVALINEMRKGNEAGAARIVSGLKQKD